MSSVRLRKKKKTRTTSLVQCLRITEEKTQWVCLLLLSCPCLLLLRICTEVVMRAAMLTNFRSQRNKQTLREAELVIPPLFSSSVLPRIARGSSCDVLETKYENCEKRRRHYQNRLNSSTVADWTSRYICTLQQNGKLGQLVGIHFFTRLQSNTHEDNRRKTDSAVSVFSFSLFSTSSYNVQ